MRVLRRSAVFIALGLAMLCGAPLSAATVAQMNLEQMVVQADQVFSGTVVGISETRVTMGGGEVPAVVYRIAVEDSFKGQFEEIKGRKYVDVKMVGTLKHVHSGRHPITDFPVLSEGGEYLLLIAHPGRTGLTAPMGLGQGTFVLTGDANDKAALNGAGNAGLFAGMNVGMSNGEAVPYNELAATIRNILGGTQ